ncbi:MAG: 30S ribosomal protein S16 [Lentisphaeria bacterium]
MAVRIRLRRTGKRNAPAHRIVVTPKRNPRNGNFIECIGTYDPRHSTESLDMERADYWLSQGAQPSETVSAIIKRCRANVSLAEQKKTVEGKNFIHESQQQKPKKRAAKPAEEDEAEAATEANAEATETAEATDEKQDTEEAGNAEKTEAASDDSETETKTADEK